METTETNENRGATYWCSEIRHSLHQSKYAHERAFNKLHKFKDRVQDKNTFKDILIALADVEYKPRFADYRDEEREKIGVALRLIRKLSAHFPRDLTIKEFIKIDKEV